MEVYIIRVGYVRYQGMLHLTDTKIHTSTVAPEVQLHWIPKYRCRNPLGPIRFQYSDPLGSIKSLVWKDAGS